MEAIDVAIAVPTAPGIEQTQEAPDGPLVFRVRVTERHIRDGVRESAGRCPLALALKDAGFRIAIVGADFAYWWRKGNRAVTARPLPETAGFVYRFDSGLPVEPGRYGYEVVP
jgi:hypothetical protein